MSEGLETLLHVTNSTFDIKNKKKTDLTDLLRCIESVIYARVLVN